MTIVVPGGAAGQRLDRFLSATAPIRTRSQAKQLIDGGRVRVDGKVGRASHVVRVGERITIDIPAPEPLAVEPEDIPLRVRYEDDALLASDKPSGMVVHPAPGARRGTLVHALAHRLGALPGPGHPQRPGSVHRLDRGTSGVALVARTAAALEGLARQFRERTVEKSYLAVVRGAIAAGAGRTDRPIGRHPRERKRMSVHSRRGRTAVTRWQVVERLPGSTVVRLFPETGRTHQLRVHLAALGHPIVGDPVYGRPGRSVPAYARQALQAEKIRFPHPTTGKTLTIRAPVPPDIQHLIATLRQAGGTTAKSSGCA